VLDYDDGVVSEAWREEATTDAIEPTTMRLCSFARDRGMPPSRLSRLRDTVRSAVARSIATTDVGTDELVVSAAADSEWLTIRLDSPSPLDYMDATPFVFASVATRVTIAPSRESVSSMVLEFALDG
jgi:hypothetical protein